MLCKNNTIEFAQRDQAASRRDAGTEIMVCVRSNFRLSPRVSVALFRILSSNFQSESEAFSISSNSKKLSFNLWVGYCPRATCVISGVLEFPTIQFDHRVRISKQDFRGCFHHSRLTRTRRPKEQIIPDWPPESSHLRAINLEQVGENTDCFILADDFTS
jgi:hypothetical protein